VHKSDDENRKYTLLIFDQILPLLTNYFGQFYGNLSEWPEENLLYLVAPLRLIVFGIRSLKLSDKESFKMITIKILEHGVIDSNSDSSQKVTCWTTLLHLAVRILLEVARTEPQLLNDLHENDESSLKVISTLQKLTNEEQNDEIQLQAVELLSLVISEEQFVKTVDENKVCSSQRNCNDFTVLVFTGGRNFCEETQ
jgi:hypothetical protein